MFPLEEDKNFVTLLMIMATPRLYKDQKKLDMTVYTFFVESLTDEIFSMTSKTVASSCLDEIFFTEEFKKAALQFWNDDGISILHKAKEQLKLGVLVAPVLNCAGEANIRLEGCLAELRKAAKTKREEKERFYSAVKLKETRVFLA